MDILNAFKSSGTTGTGNQLTVTFEHSIEVSASDQSIYRAGPPGSPNGDKFVYLKDVRVLWVIAGGELSFTVLGFDGEREWLGADLLSDQAALRGAGPDSRGPKTNLDPASVDFLLGLDPFASTPNPTLSAPRFVPNEVPTDAGDAGPTGSQRTQTHQVTTTDINSQVQVVSTIADSTPGWADALFGSNQSTDTTITLTYSVADSVTTSQSQEVTVNVWGNFGFRMWNDNLFGTLAFMEIAPQDRKPITARPVAAPSPV
jgi:hypothetical protein